MDPGAVGPVDAGSARGQWTAVLLAGGRSSRFGSDKVLARLAGTRLVDLVLSAIPSDVPVILVGPDPGSLPAWVRQVRETPAFGGPVAGIATALPLIHTPLLGVIAADMPAAAGHLPGLVVSLLGNPGSDLDVVDESDDVDEPDACLPVDPSGRLQPLCGAYRVAAVARVIRQSGNPAGMAMRTIVDQLRVRAVPWPAQWTWDVDTPEDLRLGQDVLAVESNEGVGDQDREAADGQG